MKLKSKVKIIAIAITSALAANANATTFHNQGAVLGYGDAAKQSYVIL